MSVPALAAALLYAAAPVQGAPQTAASAPAGPAPVAAPATTDAAPAAPAAPTTPAAPAQAARASENDQVDIVVTARAASPIDPLARFNVESFKAIQSVDKAVIGPIAHGYEKGVPGPVRSGLRNFLRNLDEPVSFVNYLLQLKPGRAVKSLGRFTVNSTLGFGGVFDVAKRKPFNLPYKPNGFANTFACWGIGNGPYFFLPLVGPITLRDMIGLGMDRAAIPLAVGKPFNKPYYAIPAGVIDSLNDRIEMDGQLNKLREESPDPYVAMRELYLKQRRAEVGAICPRHGDAKPDPALPPRVGKGEN